ncbi:MAG: hypothetical protein R2828_03835 [Saprospiraceae bacterium]
MRFYSHPFMLANHWNPRWVARLFSVALIMIGIMGCKDKAPASDEQSNSLPKDFITFYHRFLSDSIYQIEHISFPLEGIPDNVANYPAFDDTFRWQAATWAMHRPFDLKANGFTSTFKQIGPIIIEEIQHESGQFGMLRRFSNNGEEWTLIYYAGLNPLKS